jgi:hypothetical protein
MKVHRLNIVTDLSITCVYTIILTKITTGFINCKPSEKPYKTRPSFGGYDPSYKYILYAWQQYTTKRPLHRINRIPNS